MKFIATLLSASLLITGALSFAGQSGYLLNGKLVVTHKDGVPVNPPLNNEDNADRNPTLTDSAKGKQKKGRQPASMIKMNGFVQFDEDDLARCYWLASKQEALQCVKLK